ncbi:hypothetical protein BSZ35_08270 [Salinibacter sp. 10B]|uniref:class I SAM-dependent methyltransferase n=1 Tax=Salinibacter sp. 10B TaxID=1923971 RepID=UPI000CF3B8D6|nr:class I SAM-dependent methyltransferase [Salinibacter sp. 10B]PQJ34594.1 hypothetical protein BSZ35_08270 [Salinibacter sp. 10B]
MFSFIQVLKNLGGGRGTFIRKAAPEKVGSILDIGCAYGWELNALSNKADRLVGIDIDEAALAQAREQYPHLTFLSCNATDLPFDDHEFDVVILSEVLEHVGEENKQLVIDEAYRVLASGGRLILTGPFDGATAWADPLDFKRRFPTLYQRYLQVSGYHPKTAIEVGHKHLSLPEIQQLFRGNFDPQETWFTGLFSPFLTWILTVGERTNLLPDGLVKRLNQLRAWEGGVSYPKALAYNIRLVARKRDCPPQVVQA